MKKLHYFPLIVILIYNCNIFSMDDAWDKKLQTKLRAVIFQAIEESFTEIIVELEEEVLEGASTGLLSADKLKLLGTPDMDKFLKGPSNSSELTEESGLKDLGYVIEKKLAGNKVDARLRMDRVSNNFQSLKEEVEKLHDTDDDLRDGLDNNFEALFNQIEALKKDNERIERILLGIKVQLNENHTLLTTLLRKPCSDPESLLPSLLATFPLESLRSSQKTKSPKPPILPSTFYTPQTDSSDDYDASKTITREISNENRPKEIEEKKKTTPPSSRDKKPNSVTIARPKHPHKDKHSRKSQSERDLKMKKRKHKRKNKKKNRKKSLPSSASALIV